MGSKIQWQRKQREKFKEQYGYSMTAYYNTGKLREEILKRDNYSCVVCGMHDREHKIKWNRPINIDHKDKNKRNNTLENLQTLCLSCHGRKDISPHLQEQQAIRFKKDILYFRSIGTTYQRIADLYKFSVATIWKWVKIWNKEVGYGTEKRDS